MSGQNGMYYARHYSRDEIILGYALMDMYDWNEIWRIARAFRGRGST